MSAPRGSAPRSDGCARPETRSGLGPDSSNKLRGHTAPDDKLWESHAITSRHWALLCPSVEEGKLGHLELTRSVTNSFFHSWHPQDPTALRGGQRSVTRSSSLNPGCVCQILTFCLKFSLKGAERQSVTHKYRHSVSSERTQTYICKRYLKQIKEAHFVKLDLYF